MLLGGLLSREMVVTRAAEKGVSACAWRFVSRMWLEQKRKNEFGDKQVAKVASLVLVLLGTFG